METLQRHFEVMYFQFSPDHEIQDNNERYRGLPTISDKMHCVLFVIDAKSLDEEGDYPVLKEIQDFLASKSTLNFTVVFRYSLNTRLLRYP